MSRGGAVADAMSTWHGECKVESQGRSLLVLTGCHSMLSLNILNGGDCCGDFCAQAHNCSISEVHVTQSDIEVGDPAELDFERLFHLLTSPDQVPQAEPLFQDSEILVHGPENAIESTVSGHHLGVEISPLVQKRNSPAENLLNQYVQRDLIHGSDDTSTTLLKPEPPSVDVPQVEVSENVFLEVLSDEPVSTGILPDLKATLEIDSDAKSTADQTEVIVERTDVEKVGQSGLVDVNTNRRQVTPRLQTEIMPEVDRHESGEGKLTSADTNFSSQLLPQEEVVQQPLPAQRVIQQIVEQAIPEFPTVQQQESQSFTIRLDPPELGEVVIEMKKSEDGVAMRVTATVPATQLLLDQNQHELSQSMHEFQGDLNLEFGGNEQSTNSHQSQSEFVSEPEWFPREFSRSPPNLQAQGDSRSGNSDWHDFRA